jgi:hypothetical protein
VPTPAWRAPADPPAARAQGSPTKDDWPQGLKLAGSMNFTFPRFARTPLASLVPNACPEAIDLMTQMLRYDPQQRPTAAECLRHPYFQVGGGISSSVLSLYEQDASRAHNRRASREDMEVDMPAPEVAEPSPQRGLPSVPLPVQQPQQQQQLQQHHSQQLPQVPLPLPLAQPQPPSLSHLMSAGPDRRGDPKGLYPATQRPSFPVIDSPRANATAPPAPSGFPAFPAARAVRNGVRNTPHYPGVPFERQGSYGGGGLGAGGGMGGGRAPGPGPGVDSGRQGQGRHQQGGSPAAVALPTLPGLAQPSRRQAAAAAPAPLDLGLHGTALHAIPSPTMKAEAEATRRREQRPSPFGLAASNSLTGGMALPSVPGASAAVAPGGGYQSKDQGQQQQQQQQAGRDYSDFMAGFSRHRKW